MQSGGSIELERDCEATQIPAGNKVTLPAGTAVGISQNLGGALTVQALGGMFQIEGKDADALGMEPFSAEEMKSKPQEGDPVDEKVIWDTLKECYDPEIPVNIVDLGLVYDVHLDEYEPGKAKVGVKMTLTAPGCGMGPVIAQGAQDRIMGIPWVDEANVEIVWDPPWHQSMITPDGRKKLGLE